MSQNPRQSKSIRAQLLTAMQVGEYAHCDRLPRESVLSEMLGISRTQLRDILASLVRIMTAPLITSWVCSTPAPFRAFTIRPTRYTKGRCPFPCE